MNKKPKLLFLRKFSEEDSDFLCRNLSEFYDIESPQIFSNESIAPLAESADVFVGNKVSQEIIDAATHLKVVQVPGAGVDNLALQMFSKKNISVCNSHSSAPYVAEYAVSLLFTLIKKIHLHDRGMREGFWFRPKNDDDDRLFMSDSIIGRKIGFLGFGHVAKAITRFLSGYDVEFKAVKRNTQNSGDILKKFDRLEFLNMKDVLSESDIIFITLPLTSETRGLISKDEFALIKKTAYLINVSRGPVVDQDSLYRALTRRDISGAAVDVWYDDVYLDGDKKFPSRRHPFHKLQNIVLSPYRSGYVMGSSPHLVDVVRNLQLFAIEGKLINLVNIESGY